MKSMDFSKIIKAGILAASLVLVPVVPSAIAQTESNNPTLDTTPLQESSDDANNWGWLGLVGLVGLANLFRKRKTTQVYREPDVASGTTGTSGTSGTGYRE